MNNMSNPGSVYDAAQHDVSGSGASVSDSSRVIPGGAAGDNIQPVAGASRRPSRWGSRPAAVPAPAVAPPPGPGQQTARQPAAPAPSPHVQVDVQPSGGNPHDAQPGQAARPLVVDGEPGVTRPSAAAAPRQVHEQQQFHYRYEPASGEVVSSRPSHNLSHFNPQVLGTASSLSPHAQPFVPSQVGQVPPFAPSQVGQVPPYVPSIQGPLENPGVRVSHDYSLRQG